MTFIRHEHIWAMGNYQCICFLYVQTSVLSVCQRFIANMKIIFRHFFIFVLWYLPYQANIIYGNISFESPGFHFLYFNKSYSNYLADIFKILFIGSFSCRRIFCIFSSYLLLFFCGTWSSTSNMWSPARHQRRSTSLGLTQCCPLMGRFFACPAYCLIPSSITEENFINISGKSVHEDLQPWQDWHPGR
jgi:hypothetical protein